MTDDRSLYLTDANGTLYLAEKLPFSTPLYRLTVQPEPASRPRHGPTCSSDPEIGCECGLADWVGDSGFRTLQEAWDAELDRAAQVMADDIDRHLS